MKLLFFIMIIVVLVTLYSVAQVSLLKAIITLLLICFFVGFGFRINRIRDRKDN